MSLRATLLSCSLALLSGLPAFAAEVDLPRFPAISPDGSEVAFSWRGDLWAVSSEGGLARRLTSHPLDDVLPRYSPDGSELAFCSRRAGVLDIYRMRRDGTALQRVTRSDVDLLLSAWGPRGATLVCDARREGDVYRSPRPYLVPGEGGPLRRLHDAFGHTAALSPDGRRAVFVRGSSSWSRRGYRGPAARDLWLYDLETGAFTRLTTWEGNDGLPRWRDAETILFASDRELETVNLYALRLEADGAPGRIERLTAFRGPDLQAFDVAHDGSRAVCAVWDTLYILELTPPDATPRALEVRAPADAGDGVALQDLGRATSTARLSPDGKVLACVAYGEVFVRGTEKHAPSRQVTRSSARERDPAWSPDGRRLYYVSELEGRTAIAAARVTLTREELRASYAQAAQDGAGEEQAGEGAGEDAEQADAEAADDPARWADALRFTSEWVVQGSENLRRPSPAPDGKRLAYLRGLADLVVRDLASGEEQVVKHSWDTGIHWRWSPDARYLAVAVQDRDFNSDVWVVPADGSEWAVNVSMHPDDDWSPRWSADGKVLAFLSTRVNDEADVWRVYLDRALEGLTRQELSEYYADAAKAAKKREPLGAKKKKKKKKQEPQTDEAEQPASEAEAPQAEAPQDGEQAREDEAKGGDAATEETPTAPPLDLEDAYLRLRRVTRWAGDERGLELSPGGERYVVGGADGEGRALFALSWDGEKKERLTGAAELQELDLQGGRAVVVQGGRAGLVPVGGGKLKSYAVDATLRLDLEAQSSQKFLEAARVLGERFYHPKMKGRDWGGLTARYHELARRARTPGEFRHVANRFVGELNASHLGIYPPRASSSLARDQGRLGIDWEPLPAGGVRVLAVVPRGPGDQPPMRLQVGDRIVALDREPLAPRDVLEARLEGRVGQEVLVGVERPREGAEALSLELLLTPVSYRAATNLRYDAWQRENARRVGEWSRGRIGYLHIRGMNQVSLEEFERDLYAAAYGKEALLLDVRNNGGGWTADRVLASIMVRAHAFTVPRGAAPHVQEGYPRGRLFIQRYTRPMNMLCNERSFSNAEILSHAFRTLERGTLVGEQTYGGVISTGGTRLIDGTLVRLPFRGWYLPDGTDMENNGAMPHLRVPQTPQDEAAGIDRQLRVATEDLLARLPE